MTSGHAEKQRRQKPAERSIAGAEHCRHWRLFADWCTATDRCPLPADPDAIVAFLAEMPAGPATVARRVRAIDAVHDDAGLSPPGVAPVFDEVLGRRPIPPRFDIAAVARALEAIPVGGWPVGIIGRRDAAIVALVCVAGFTRAGVQALRTVTSGGLPLGGPAVGREAGDPASAIALLETVVRTETPGECPACALSRWLRVANQLERSG